MTQADKLKEIVTRLIDGRATKRDQQALLQALRSGQAVLATGEQAVAIGGAVNEAIIVTGSGNIVLKGADAAVIDSILYESFHPSFNQFYARVLTSGIELLHHLGKYEYDELNRVLTGTLQIIRSVVAAYFGDKTDLQINANVMVALSIRSLDPADYPGISFLDPQRKLSSYKQILTVVQWAHGSHCSPAQFALPVDRERVWAIFGAPRAYLTGEVQVVGDIKDETELAKLLDGQPAQVADAIRHYFQERSSFRSFACFRILYGEKPIGVLNIQSNRKNIFGDSNKHQEEILGYIRPFCALLGLIVRALTAKRRTRSSEEHHEQEPAER